MINARHPKRLLIVLFVLVCTVAHTMQGQPVYRQSWTVQDRERGLRQDLARTVIRLANDYLTRDDPNGSTARLEDRLRVTVVGELQTSTGHVQPRLERLVMGTVVIDRGFEMFLNPPLIDRLVRRDYFWRDEEITVFNDGMSPLHSAVGDSSNYGIDALREYPEQGRLSLTDLIVPVTPVLSAFASLGNDALGLPNFSYGRARVGVASNGLRAWLELPLPVGSIGNPFLSRGLDAAWGLGLAFDGDYFGGSVSAAISDSPVGISPVEGTNRYLLTAAAHTYLLLPLEIGLPGGIEIVARVGGNWQQVRISDTTAGDNNAAAGGRLVDQLRGSLRLDLDLAGDYGDAVGHATLWLVGESLMASYEHRFSNIFGLRGTLSRNGLFGNGDPWLPPYSLSISPVIYIR